MNQQHSHIIQHQVFELIASGPMMGFNWEKRASDYLHNIINPGIEACFTEVSPPGQHLIIDRFEIDLGEFTIDSFAKEAGNRLIKILGQQLRACRVSAERETNTDSQTPPGFATVDQNNISKKEENQNAKLIDDAKALQIALIFFLLNGRFPWWIKISGRLPEEFSDVDWLHSLQPAECKELRQALKSSKQARIRLMNQFSAEWIAELLELIGMRGKDAWMLWQILYPALEKFTVLQTLFHQYFWLEWIASGGENADMIKIIEHTTDGTQELVIEIIIAIQRVFHEYTMSHPGNENTDIILTLDEKLINYLEHKLTTDGAAGAHSFHRVDENQQSIDELLSELSETSKDKKPAEEEGIIICAAGLVLLHPFLTELFTTTSLWNGNNWTSANAWHRAVRLLSYLSFGNIETPESNLVFHKLMVGMDAGTAIPADLPLKKEEIDSCDELLNAVITHWKVLRNTSPDGLREGFLQREAKVAVGNNGFAVYVERKAQDVLLSHLPWGYSMIKLPWLEKIVHVSWI
jgi:hypothetical protein